MLRTSSYGQSYLRKQHPVKWMIDKPIREDIYTQVLCGGSFPFSGFHPCYYFPCIWIFVCAMYCQQLYERRDGKPLTPSTSARFE